MKNKKTRAKVGAIRRTLIALAIVLGIGVAPSMAAEDAGALDAAALITSVDVSEVPDVEPTVPEIGSNEDLIAKLKAAKDSVDNYKSEKEKDENPIKYAIALMIAAFANLLLSGVKRAMKLTGKAKKILPWVAVGLGAIVTGAMATVGGASLSTSIFYGGAVLGAVVLQELGIIPIKSTDSNPAA